MGGQRNGKVEKIAENAKSAFLKLLPTSWRKKGQEPPFCRLLKLSLLSEKGSEAAVKE